MEPGDVITNEYGDIVVNGDIQSMIAVREFRDKDFPPVKDSLFYALIDDFVLPSNPKIEQGIVRGRGVKCECCTRCV